jgi:hypothetical protein
MNQCLHKNRHDDENYHEHTRITWFILYCRENALLKRVTIKHNTAKPRWTNDYIKIGAET